MNNNKHSCLIILISIIVLGSCQNATRSRTICYDDVEWLISNDNGGSDSFELECRENGRRTIRINDGFLYFTKQQTASAFEKSNFAKPDCQRELEKFVGLRKNYTYTIDAECTSQTSLLASNAGVRCKLRKSFLKDRLFKTDLVVLKSNRDIYPYPYGLLVTYNCL